MRSMRLFILLFCIINGTIWCDWVWSPGTGWINTKYNPRESAKTLYVKAEQFMKVKNYEKAVETYNRIVLLYPNTPEAKQALYTSAKCYFKLQQYLEAYLVYEKYIEKYPKTDKLQEILKEEYEIGAILVQGKKKGEAIPSTAPMGVEVLEKIVQKSPFAHFSDDALIIIANYYYKIQEYEEAQGIYLKVTRNYPKSEWHEVAQYQIAMCSLRQYRGISYDIEALHTTKKKLKEYSITHPEGRLKNMADKKKQEVEELLCKKELSIAEFYIFKGKIRSAKIYLQYIIKQFEGTQSAKRAKYLLTKLK